jgi:hypothetical protein
MFDLRNPSFHTMPWRFTQPVRETSTRRGKLMFLGSRSRQVSKADNFATIYADRVVNVGPITSHNSVVLHKLPSYGLA